MVGGGKVQRSFVWEPLALRAAPLPQDDKGVRMTGLMDACPNLVDDYADHEYQVDAQGPEQEHLGAGEMAAWEMVLIFRGNDLVGLE